jgi:hypothetical protein
VESCQGFQVSLVRASSKLKNIFWIGATLTFDLQTGATNQILTFVYREQDASVFVEDNAKAYMDFIRVRAEHFSKGIKWSIETSGRVPQRWVIRGEQDVI